MESKTMTRNRDLKLVFHAFKEKKNLVLLLSIMLIITVLILPMLLASNEYEVHLVLGIIEVTAIVIISSLLDLNYLHDAKKYSYYLTKPQTPTKRIQTIIATNILFGFTFMIILMGYAFFHELDLEYFVIPFAWLPIIILLTTLSSIITGNTVVAAIVTAINFGLPMLILGVIYYVADIVSNIANGFDAQIVLDLLIRNFYRIDILYFVKFIDEFNIAYYLITLLSICFLLYHLIIFTLKIRKNERIGQFVLFTNYKNFISLLIASLVPFLFSTMLNNHDYLAKLISFVLLGALAYYILLVIMEKSFKLNKKALTLLVVFMLVFVASVSFTGIVIKKAASVIPEASEIEAVMISNSNWVYVDQGQFGFEIKHLDLNKPYASDLPIYYTDEAIELVRKLQGKIIDNPGYTFDNSFYLVYFLKDGTKEIRYFKLISTKSNDGTLDKITTAIFDLEEFKLKQYPFIYDELISDNWRRAYLTIYADVNSVMELDASQIKGLRNELKKDFDIQLLTQEYSLNAWIIGEPLNDYNYFDNKSYYDSKEIPNQMSLVIKSATEKEYNIQITEDYIHTYEYLKSLNTK